jgi:hypothetical protein
MSESLLEHAYTCPVCEGNTLSVLLGTYQQPGYVLPHPAPCFEVLCFRCASGGKILEAQSVDDAVAIMCRHAWQHPEWRREYLSWAA